MPMENQDALPATKGDITRLAVEIVKNNARIDKLGDGLRAEMREGNSRILKTVEAFAVQTKMVDRHQIITDYRVAELEKRVKGLELPH